jgi:tetratricopeptide (TPR) repeat protein
LVLEKLPLVALSVASSIVTLIVQRQGGSLVKLEHFGTLARVENAILGYVAYLGKTLWPVNLASLYPLLPITSVGTVLAAAAGLAALSAAALWGASRGRRYLAVGWFWFLGTLVPVIGIVQVGEQSMADRYTYFPLIGLFVLVTWGAADLLTPWRHGKAAMIALAAVTVAACSLLSARQAGFWHDSETLFRHALAVTSNNRIVHNNLGNILSWDGRNEEAIAHYKLALAISPNYAEGHNNLANTLSNVGRVDGPDGAIAHYLEALRLDPDFASAHCNLGNRLTERGKAQEAMAQYQAALACQPGFADAEFGMGNVLANLGRYDEAIRQYRKTLSLNPRHLGAAGNLGIVLLHTGQTRQAIEYYRELVRAFPQWTEPLLRLSQILATASKPEFRDGAEAVRRAEQGCALTGRRDPVFLDALAAAYAEAGRFPEAVATATTAAALAKGGLAEEIQARLRLYRAGRPCRAGP